MGSKLTIEIEEGSESSVLRLFVDGEQLEPVSDLKLDASKLDVVIPAVEVRIGEGLSPEDVAKAPADVRESLTRTVAALRKFRCVEVTAPGGI